MEIPDDAYRTFSQNWISCSTIGEEYCRLIVWRFKIMKRQLWTLTIANDVTIIDTPQMHCIGYYITTHFTKNKTVSCFLTGLSPVSTHSWVNRYQRSVRPKSNLNGKIKVHVHWQLYCLMSTVIFTLIAHGEGRVRGRGKKIHYRLYSLGVSDIVFEIYWRFLLRVYSFNHILSILLQRL